MTNESMDRLKKILYTTKQWEMKHIFSYIHSYCRSNLNTRNTRILKCMRSVFFDDTNKSGVELEMAQLLVWVMINTNGMESLTLSFLSVGKALC
jgi:hypothetical protein